MKSFRRLQIPCFCVMLYSISGQSQANTAPYEWVSGLKNPNHPEVGLNPVQTRARISKTKLGGFNTLLPYVLASPNQEDAGSCLYMALTGAAEWWLAKLNPQISRQPDGPLDLSERYLMNLAGLEEEQNGVGNWKTDSVYLYNNVGQALRNIDFPYAKGWYVAEEDAYRDGSPEERGAAYGTSYNWINKLDQIGHVKPVDLPELERNVLFADPESNQWNVAVAPADIVERVKQALVTQKAPVLVIYNHYGYWHAVLIVGFDDRIESDCTFVEGTAPYLEKSAAQWFQQAQEMDRSPEEREKLLARAQRYHTLSERLVTAFKPENCSGRGSFYVRDSLYPDPEGPIYDYDRQRSGEEAPYARKIILREYEWLRYLANHVTQIVVPDQGSYENRQ